MGQVHLCRVADKTVRSNMVGDAPQLGDGFPIFNILTFINYLCCCWWEEDVDSCAVSVLLRL